MVVREGEVGDRVFFRLEGEAEVWIDGPQGTVSLATLARDMFGELAIFAPGGRPPRERKHAYPGRRRVGGRRSAGRRPRA